MEVASRQNPFMQLVFANDVLIYLCKTFRFVLISQRKQVLFVLISNASVRRLYMSINNICLPGEIKKESSEYISYLKLWKL